MVLSNSRIIELLYWNYNLDDFIKHAFPNVRGVLEETRGFFPNVHETIKPLPHHRGTFIQVQPELPLTRIGIDGFDLRLGELVSWSDYIAQNVTLDDMLRMSHKRD